MTTRKNLLSRDHKTRTEKCKGRMVDPPESYGKWAYWWAGSSIQDRGWRNRPRTRKEDRP